MSDFFILLRGYSNCIRCYRLAILVGNNAVDLSSRKALLHCHAVGGRGDT